MSKTTYNLGRKEYYTIKYMYNKAQLRARLINVLINKWQFTYSISYLMVKNDLQDWNSLTLSVFSFRFLILRMKTLFSSASTFFSMLTVSLLPNDGGGGALCCEWKHLNVLSVHFIKLSLREWFFLGVKWFWYKYEFTIHLAL